MGESRFPYYIVAVNPETVHTASGWKIAIEKSIAGGLHFLQQHQYPNGEFCVYVSGNDEMLGDARPDSNIFPTALIGASLLFLRQKPGVLSVLQKAAEFLRGQMGRGGTWNHFTNGHPLRAFCPQDADDTACVAHFLEAMEVSFPKEHTASLLLHNRRKDGLFYTWFALRMKTNPQRLYWQLALKELKQPVKNLLFWQKMECKRNDVDAVVNANVLFYLGRRRETEAALAYLLRIVEENREDDCDKWYRNPFTVYYFFSRAYSAGLSELEPLRRPIIERLLDGANRNGFGQTPLDTALAACTLMNLKYAGEALDSAIQTLLQTQLPGGCWPRYRLYYGGPKKTVGYGSEELTTAFCLEALERYGALSGPGE